MNAAALLVAIPVQLVAAGEAGDPCARPCGLEHTCGELQGSLPSFFTCEAFGQLGCDCTGCCATSLIPVAQDLAAGAPELPEPQPTPRPPPAQRSSWEDLRVDPELRTERGSASLKPVARQPAGAPRHPPLAPPTPGPVPTVVRARSLQADEPCARPCGRGLTCATQYGAFTCEALDLLGCDCSGCCVASLSPLAPPAPPPPLPPPPSSPAPLLPPMAPGGLAVGSTAELRTALEEGSTHINLLPIVYLLGGEPLNVSGGDVTLEGLDSQEGAFLDAEGLSRAIDVSDGAHLTLRRIHIVNGVAESGGGLLVQGAGSSLLMEQASVRHCEATSLLPFVYGGGGLASPDSPPSAPHGPPSRSWVD